VITPKNTMLLSRRYAPVIVTAVAACACSYPNRGDQSARSVADPDARTAIAVGGATSAEAEATLRREMQESLQRSYLLRPPATRVPSDDEGPPSDSCASVPVVSPDRSCRAYFEASTATTLSDSSVDHDRWESRWTTVSLACSSMRGGLQRPIVMLHDTVTALPIGWIDSETLSVGIPVAATFSPPVETVDDLGRTISVRYFPFGPDGKPLAEIDNVPRPVTCEPNS
jgi:hypothetical protein